MTPWSIAWHNQILGWGTSIAELVAISVLVLLWKRLFVKRRKDKVAAIKTAYGAKLGFYFYGEGGWRHQGAMRSNRLKYRRVDEDEKR